MGKKKYVILIPNITGMGGAQMYVRNKLIYMQENGWEVDLISAYSGKVYIENLIKYDYYIPELIFCNYLFNRKKRSQIIDNVIKRIFDRKYVEIVIESTCIPTCTWGEEIAKKCNARHFCYLLQEDNTITSRILQKYFIFKYNRRELASITDNSIYDMFLPFAPISLEQSIACQLPAFCNNVIEDIDSNWLKIVENVSCDYKIGFLSRLDKPFVLPVLKDIINYVKIYSNKHFLLVLVGGTTEGKVGESQIYNMFRHIPNVHLIITGLMFPIPTKLFDLFDVFLTSAGSAWVCMKSGIPTISIDGKDFKPIGILGRTTNHSLFRGMNEPPLNLQTLLRDILQEKKFEKCKPLFEESKLDFSIHERFLSNMLKEKVYYIEENPMKSWSEKWMSIKLTLLGANNYIKINRYKVNIINAFKALKVI